MMIVKTELHPHALHAVRAASCWHVWGAYAARQYCRRHGAPDGLLTLARILETARKAGI